jgi:hypothetical protein
MVPDMNDVPRIGAPEVARRIGRSLRGVQALAARGAIPGAAMIGGRWSFDPVKLKQWIEDLENATARSASARPSHREGYSAPVSAALLRANRKAAEAYERLMKGKGRKSKKEN